MNKDQDMDIYIDDPDRKARLYKRTLLVVVISQIFGGAGLAAGITVGALLAQDMLGTDSLAGLPVGLFTLGSALAAFLVGRLSQRMGRRTGLAAGFMAGGLGAAGVVLAAIIENPLLLFISFFIYGAGTATNLQARYAGTDLAEKHQRATSVSIAMVSTTLGAVAGPNLVEVMGDFARMINVPELAGPFILAGAAFVTAGLILTFFLRPDPFKVAQVLEAERQRAGTFDATERTENDQRGIMLAALIMVVTQIVMVAVMTMTPVHMGNHGHDLGAIGMVIGFHIAGMYLPSLFTGILIDKIGRVAMTIAAAIILLISGIIAAAAPGESFAMMAISLTLLGVGWNLGLISGTTILVDATAPHSRAKTQGTVDVLIALSGAAGGAMSGVVAAGAGFGFLSISGGVLALGLIPALYLMHPGEN
ncbi:MFS transporter [Salinicoccus roseus]|uniref:MFS transporter n=1 Tax=Salinicoccus roseus TaxID=45670 RepID=A0A0C2E362_9STAP|nr:MFS transporter [Salinicoccus roseus]KIH69862.1 MFS transporter [Salinicoccus roseus]MDB0579252.1 MFS transporter [Salinicoccus roseus]